MRSCAKKKLLAEAAESPKMGIPPAPVSGTRPCNSLPTIYVANPPNKIKANLVDYSLLTNWNFYYIFGLGISTLQVFSARQYIFGLK